MFTMKNKSQIKTSKRHQLWGAMQCRTINFTLLVKFQGLILVSVICGTSAYIQTTTTNKHKFNHFHFSKAVMDSARRRKILFVDTVVHFLQVQQRASLHGLSTKVTLCKMYECTTIIKFSARAWFERVRHVSSTTVHKKVTTN